jgi:prepilin-type processing-associated H-X9-DG protein
VAYVGDSDDIRRTPTGNPASDRSLAATGQGAGGTGFGGPHSSGANIAYCDGSVRFVRDDEQVEQ